MEPRSPPHAPPATPASPDAEPTKRFQGPVTIEQGFRVDGKKLTILVTFPAQVAQEVGMEALTLAANRAIVSIETKNHAVEKIR